MKHFLWMMILCAGLMTIGNKAFAAEDPVASPDPAAVAAAPDGGGTLAPSGDAPAPAPPKQNFFHVITGSGPLGILLWLMLFGALGWAIYLVVDCAITVRAQKIMPQGLIDTVTEAMGEGDVLKALQCCENEPGPMANILTAGFSHVEEGYDIIQESIATSADLETERIMQKLTWLSVVGNIAPMLGLMGTVQGMILAFGSLSGGAPDVGALANNISQALYTTFAGLFTAVPCVAFYYSFRNNANKIVLRMEAITMELIKDLRNVEVVED